MPNLYRRLLQSIPSPCIVCGKSSQAAYSLCPDCETDLPWAGPCCIRCGEELSATSPDPRSCAGCTLHPPPFASCSAAFRYQSPIDSLLSGFKFKARFEAGNVLALLLAEKIAQHYRNTTAPDLLLPVPLHQKRLRQRGFNQALEITRVVSRKMRYTFLSKCHRENAGYHGSDKDAFRRRPQAEFKKCLWRGGQCVTASGEIGGADR